jgi:hypothetical protein
VVSAIFSGGAIAPPVKSEGLIAAEVAAKAVLLICGRGDSPLDEAQSTLVVHTMLSLAHACGSSLGGEAIDPIDSAEPVDGQQANSYNSIIGAAMIVSAAAPRACAEVADAFLSDKSDSGAAKAVSEHCQLLSILAVRKSGK